MKNVYFLIIVLFLSYRVVYGQITTEEEPISFKSNVPDLITNEKTMKLFVALDMKKIEQEDREDEKNGLPPRFGYPHKVNYTLDNSGEWVTLPNGDKIWRLIISCQNALSINLLYDKFWVPDGAKFFVYGKDRKQTIGAVTSANNKGDKNDMQGFATGLVYDDQTPQGIYHNNFFVENSWQFNTIQTANGHSVAEPGSSGSPLINNNRKVIGQLWATVSSDCANPANGNPDAGKFSISWTGNGATDSRRRLSNWLDPINTGVSVLDGCSGIVDFNNQTVTTTTTVTNNCGSINITNTTVTPSGTLNVHAAKAINIGPNFTVQSGAGLNITVDQ